MARLSPTLDPANRSADVEIVIDNADLRLKPGMFAKVALILRQRDDALLVLLHGARVYSSRFEEPIGALTALPRGRVRRA